MTEETAKIIQSLNNNSVLSAEARGLLYSYACDFINFASSININIDVDNLCNNFSTLTQDISENHDKIDYDPIKNAIVTPKDKDYDPQILENELQKAVLKSIITRRNNDVFSVGLEIKKNERNIGKGINDAIVNGIIQHIYGNPDEMRVTLPNYKDKIFKDMQDIIGLDVFSYFLFSDGEELFNKFSSIYGSEQEAFNFYDNIDSGIDLEPFNHDNSVKLYNIEEKYNRDIDMLRQLYKKDLQKAA